MILGMGVPELAIILAVVLVIFGPKNLPKIGSSVGKTVKNFREGMEGDVDEPKPSETAATTSQAVASAPRADAEMVDPDDVDAE